MLFMIINQRELSALNGLPHLQQLLYLCGIRPYVDYKTRIAGIKRGISYQSLAEALYVEPHPGIKSGSPSKDQIRRALKGLEKTGLIKINSAEFKLIFQCALVHEPLSDQNKAAIKPPEYPATKPTAEIPLFSSKMEDVITEAATIEGNKATIPLKSNNYVCVYSPFEKFWALYPKKTAKQKAFEEFQALQPTDELVNTILIALEQQIEAVHLLQAQGQWVPKWKFPANWLAQHCWNDEITTLTTMENHHVSHQKHHQASEPVDHFWESCKAGATPSTGNTILTSKQE